MTLGTPHGGSELARFGIGENARQMRPGSAWLASLGAPPVATLTIYSAHDNYVLPPANLELPGARRCVLDRLGHLAMLFSPRGGAGLARRLVGRLRLLNVRLEEASVKTLWILVILLLPGAALQAQGVYVTAGSQWPGFFG